MCDDESMRWVAIIGILTGCSWIGANGPSDIPYTAGPPAECTDSYVLPIIDTVPAVALDTFATLALGVIAAVVVSNKPGDAGSLGAAIAAFTGVPAAIVGGTYTASAVHGYRTVVECNNSKR
jgi:hypothetical protein